MPEWWPADAEGERAWEAKKPAELLQLPLLSRAAELLLLPPAPVPAAVAAVAGVLRPELYSAAAKASAFVSTGSGSAWVKYLFFKSAWTMVFGGVCARP